MRPLQYPDEDADEDAHYQKAPEYQKLPEGVPALCFVQGIYLRLILACIVEARMTLACFKLWRKQHSEMSCEAGSGHLPRLLSLAAGGM